MAIKPKSAEFISDSESEPEVEYERDEEYEGPLGFDRVKSIKTLSSKAFENKELWLVEVPSGIDISSLKELPLPIPQDEVKDSKKHKKHEKNSKNSVVIPSQLVTTAKINGSQYSLVSDNQHKLLSTNEKDEPVLRLLVPSASKVTQSDTDVLSVSEKTFSRVITITPSVTIPEIDYKAVIQPQPDVEQLKDMQLKHYATGYSDGKTYEGPAKKDAEPEVTGSKKRSHEENEETEKKEKKKSKKDKKDKKEKKEKKEKKKAKKDEE